MPRFLIVRLKLRDRTLAIKVREVDTLRRGHGDQNLIEISSYTVTQFEAYLYIDSVSGIEKNRPVCHHLRQHFRHSTAAAVAASICRSAATRLELDVIVTESHVLWIQEPRALPLQKKPIFKRRTPRTKKKHYTTAIMASPAGGEQRSSSSIILNRQYKQMQTDKDIPGISCGLVNNSLYEWEVMLMLSDEQDSLYGGKPASHPRSAHPHTTGPSIYEEANNFLPIHRRHIPRSSPIPRRISAPTAQTQIRNSHFPPQRLPQWRSLHQHLAPSRRRPVRL